MVQSSLNPNAEISHFSENTAAATKVHTSRRYLSSSPTNKNDKVLDLIGDRSIDRAALHDVNIWPIRMPCDKERITQLWTSDVYFHKKETGRHLINTV